MLGRAVKIALVLFALAIGGLALTAWLLGDPARIEFDYEGFD